MSDEENENEIDEPTEQVQKKKPGRLNCGRQRIRNNSLVLFQ